MGWNAAETLQTLGFQLHLKCKEEPLPRRDDVVLMKFFMNRGLDKEDLLSFLRVKGKLGTIFLPNLATANDKHLETFAYQKESSAKLKSKYKFPREEPTDHDWQVWIGSWCQHTVGNF